MISSAFVQASITIAAAICFCAISDAFPFYCIEMSLCIFERRSAYVVYSSLRAGTQVMRFDGGFEKNLSEETLFDHESKAAPGIAQETDGISSACASDHRS